jgi:hypothetical protein
VVSGATAAAADEWSEGGFQGHRACKDGDWETARKRYDDEFLPRANSLRGDTQPPTSIFFSKSTSMHTLQTRHTRTSVSL